MPKKVSAETKETPVVRAYVCQRCQHRWAGRMKSTPHTCPACKSALWDIPKEGAERIEVEPMGTLRLEISADVHRRAVAEAARRGITLDEFVILAIDQHIGPPPKHVKRGH